VSSVQQTSDGGYIIAGTTSGGITADIGLIKTDSMGTVLWSKSYDGGSCGAFDLFSSNSIGSTPYVQQTSDGGYIITGETFCMDGSDADVFLIKTFSNGNLDWSETYGGSDGDGGYYVRQTSDLGYLITGYTFSFDAKDSANAYILKTNSAGTLQWDLAVRISPNDDDGGNSAVEVSDGYIITGYSQQVNSVDTTADISLIKTNTSGALQWVKTFGDTADDEVGNSIELLSSGNVIIGGYTSKSASGADGSDAVLIETNISGTIAWSSSYDLADLDMGYAAQQTADGGYSLYGFTISNLFPLTYSNFFMKTNSSGTAQFGMFYTNNAFPVFLDGKQTNDGGHIIVGLGAGTGFDYFMIKTDTLGNSGCFDSVATPVNRTYAPTVDTPAGTTFTGGSTNSLTADVNTITPTDSVYCITAPCTPPPTPTLTTTDVNVCESESGVVYTTQSGFTTYTWSVSGGTIASGQGTNSITVNWGTGPSGTVDLVIDSAGCAGNLATENVSIANPSPTLTVSSTSVCEGQTAVTYTTQAGFTTYTWTVTGGTIASGAGTNSITVNWGTPGAGTVDLTVVDADGCAGSLSPAEAVTINANPSPTLTVTDTDVCEGETSVIYTTQSGFTTYTWTVSGGTIAGGAGTNSITVDWGTPGAGTVDLTVVDGNGCTGSLSATESITINANPSPTLTATDTSVCEGEASVVYTTQSGFVSYTWTVTGGTIAGGAGTNSITVDWGTPGAGTVDLTVVDGNGCSGSLSATESVTINANPSPTLTVTSTSVCDGATGVVYTTQTGFTTYTWTVTGGTITSGAGTNSITVDWGTPGAGTVDLTVVDVNGCSGSLSATESVTINTNPIAIITPLGVTSFCTGDSTLLQSDPATTYLWLLNSSSTGLSSQNIYVTTAGDYQVVVTNAAGCSDTSAITAVVENPSPIANITPLGPISFCFGDSVALQADSASIYDWLLNGVSTGQTTQTITVTSSGDYQVSVSNAFCQDTSSIVTVTVNSTPLIDTTSMVIDSSTCTNSDGSITGISSSGNAPFTYEWTNSVSTVVGGDSLNLQSVPSDSYTLLVTDANGCTASESFVIFDIGAPISPVAGNDSTYCQGDSIADLTATGGGTLVWYSDAALTDSVGTGTTFSSGATSTDTFYVAVVSSGCQSTSDMVIITITPLPSAPVAGNDTTYCVGDSVADLFATGSGGTLIWYSNSALTDSIGSGSLFSSGANSDTVIYVTEMLNGCKGPADSVSITFNALPPLPIISNDSNYCSGDSVADLTATGTGGIIMWYSDAALTDSIFSGSLFSSGATTDTTFYVTETISGCESMPDSITITFTSTPVVNVSTSQDTICPGGNITLTATGAGSYVWNTGATTSTIVVNPLTNTTYLVSGTTNGCPSLPVAISIATDSSLIPIVTIDQGSNVTICLGNSITLTASGGGTYLWNTGDTTGTIIVNPIVNTVYSVATTTWNGCTSAADSITISVAGVGIVAGFTADPTSGMIPLTVNFTDISIGAVSWQWDFSYDSALFNIESTQQNPTYTYTEGELFQAMLIAFDGDGCNDTASIIIEATAIQSVFIPSLFSPNGDGMNDILYVRGNGIDKLELVIYDRWGEKVFEGDKSQVWAKEKTYPTNVGWDGTYKGQPLNTAVFVYILKGAFTDGKAIDEKGNITLIR